MAFAPRKTTALIVAALLSLPASAQDAPQRNLSVTERIAAEFNSDIFLYHRVTGEFVRVTDSDAYWEVTPCFHPEAGKLVYASNEAGAFDIWVHELGGGARTRLTASDGTDEIEPVYDPTRPGFLYAVREFKFPRERWLESISLDGTAAAILDPAPHFSLSNRPGAKDGRGAYTAIDRRHGAIVSRVCALGPDGAAVVLNAYELGFVATQASLSPDGKRLAFRAHTYGWGDIGVWDIEAEELTWVTQTDTDESWPAWAPNGTELAYASAAEGHYRLCIADLASSETITLDTPSACDDVAPSWSTDGTAIAFQRIARRKPETEMSYKLPIVLIPQSATAAMLFPDDTIANFSREKTTPIATFALGAYGELLAAEFLPSPMSQAALYRNAKGGFDIVWLETRNPHLLMHIADDGRITWVNPHGPYAAIANAVQPEALTWPRLQDGNPKFSGFSDIGEGFIDLSRTGHDAESVTYQRENQNPWLLELAAGGVLSMSSDIPPSPSAIYQTSSEQGLLLYRLDSNDSGRQRVAFVHPDFGMEIADTSLSERHYKNMMLSIPEMTESLRWRYANADGLPCPIPAELGYSFNSNGPRITVYADGQISVELTPST